MERRSTLTCPHCGHQATETMPTDYCLYFYDCGGCGQQLKPLKGHCCVFCSYGRVPARRSRRPGRPAARAAVPRSLSE